MVFLAPDLTKLEIYEETNRGEGKGRSKLTTKKQAEKDKKQVCLRSKSKWN